jgi:hypothetical protein
MSSKLERDDDYLWDRSGPADAGIAELERLLAPKAWQPRARPGLRAPRPRPARRRSWRVAFAAAAVLATVALGLQAWYAYRLQWPAAQPWRITATEGAVTMAGAVVAADAALAPGNVLETGVGASARLRVARIGEMVLGEGSQFALVETGDGRHRTRLQRGRLWARIWAPPGTFGVSTPAGEVFDLGCEFVLQANGDGSGALTVRSGWVQVENAWREVLVPEGARVEFGARGEPGIPYDLGASPAFIGALRELHAQGRRAEPGGAAVRAVVAASRPQDAISLIYLLQFHPPLAAGPVYDRMVEIMPADARVDRDDLRLRGAAALSPWWNALPYPRIKRWWLQWPDAFSSGDASAVLLRDEVR